MKVVVYISRLAVLLFPRQARRDLQKKPPVPLWRIIKC